MNIARTLTIFILLAALSFVLGFFVLARMIPGGPKPAAGTIAIAPPENSRPVTVAPPRGAVGAALPPVTAAAGKPAAAPNKPQTTPSAPGTGPSLNPAAENAAKGPAAGSDTANVQKPRTVEHVKTDVPVRSADTSDSTRQEETGTPPAKSETDEPPATRARAHRKHRHARKVEAASGNNRVSKNKHTSEDNHDTEAPAPHKRLSTRRMVVRTASDSAPAEAGAIRTRVRPRADTETSFVTTRDSAGALYHVRLGSYRSRDLARSEADRARARGFDANVVPMTRNGRTFYRVQAGAFRDRSRAEDRRQSLHDANLNAEITE